MSITPHRLDSMDGHKHDESSRCAKTERGQASAISTHPTFRETKAQDNGPPPKQEVEALGVELIAIRTFIELGVLEAVRLPIWRPQPALGNDFSVGRLRCMCGIGLLACCRTGGMGAG